MVKIAIDAGHGINTAGKRVPTSLGYGDIREWTLNNKVVVEIIKLLNQYQNVEILRLDDPTGRRDVPLAERSKKANNWGADIVISIHHNAGINLGTGGGLVIYRYPNSSKFTKKMQQELYNSIIKETGLKGNRASPLAESNLHMLRVPIAAAVLPELGFMDSRSDIKEIVKPDWSIKNARGVVNWLEKHYKLKKKVKPKQSKSDGYYRVVVGSFANKKNAEEQQKKLKARGFDSFLAYYED